MGKPTDEFVAKQMSRKDIRLALIEQGQAKEPATKEEKYAEWLRLQTAGDQAEIHNRLLELGNQSAGIPISVDDIFEILAMFEWQAVNSLKFDPTFWRPGASQAERNYWKQAGKNPKW